MEKSGLEKKCFLCRVEVKVNWNDGKHNVCNFCPAGSDSVYYCSVEHLSIHRGNSHQNLKNKVAFKNAPNSSKDVDEFKSECCEKETANSIEPDFKCWPFCIETRQDVGRIMVATRDIRAGEVILEEAPAVWGPNSKSAAVCLECLKPCITSVTTDEENLSDLSEISMKTCSKCHFPVCGEECKLIFSLYKFYDYKL